ncbi:MAG: hypothetical protein QM775_14955 [Pirellulales bacterium]
MIITCECGGKVATDAKQCPHCGKPGPFAPPAPPPQAALGKQVVTAIVLALLGAAIVIKLMN